MNKRLVMFVVLGMIAALLVGGVAVQGYVLAQEPDPPVPPRGYGWRGAYEDEDFVNPYHEEMEAAIADILGISVEQLEAAHEEGKTLYDLAEELGLDFADVREAMWRAREEIMGWSGGPGRGFGHGWTADEAYEGGWMPCWGARGRGWAFEDEGEGDFEPNAWGRRRGGFRR